jgi:hypothetical protein
MLGPAVSSSLLLALVVRSSGPTTNESLAAKPECANWSGESISP